MIKIYLSRSCDAVKNITYCEALSLTYVVVCQQPTHPIPLDLAKISPHILIPERFALHLGVYFVSKYAHINKAFITIEKVCMYICYLLIYSTCQTRFYDLSSSIPSCHVLTPPPILTAAVATYSRCSRFPRGREDSRPSTLLLPRWK
jgi:hypothetical protein